MKRAVKPLMGICTLVLGAVIVRVIYLHQFSASPLFNVPIGPDVEEYDNWAREILAWGLIPGKPHIHAPLYPLGLAAWYGLLGFRMFWVRLFQSLLVLGGFGILSWTVARIVAPGRNLVKWLFPALAAFYPLLWFYSSELICETLLLPLICLTVALLYRSEDRLAANDYRKSAVLIGAGGFCAGLMAITHPLSLMFIAAETVFLAVAACRRFFARKTRSGLLLPLEFVLPAVLVIAPVCIHNSRLAGRFVLIQENGGFNFYLGHNPAATGTCYLRPGPAWNGLHRWAEAAAARQGIGKDEFLAGKVFEFIRSNPGRELGLLVKKAFYVWNFRELASGADVAPLVYFTGMVRSGKYLFILLGSLSLSGLVLVLRRRKTAWQYRHFLLLLASGWMAQILTVTSGRYRLAMYPALFVLAAFSVEYFVRHVKNRRRTLEYSLIFLFGFLVVTLPVPPADIPAEQAEAASLLGEAWFRQGNYRQAAAGLQASLKYHPADARAFNLLGIIAEKSSPARAAEYYRRAVKSAPDEAEGYLNLAIQYSTRNELAPAAEYFAAALRRGPDNPEVLYNYGCFLLKKGQTAAAAEYLEKCLRKAPWNDKALNTLGVIRIQNGQPAVAVDYLRRAHRLAPDKTGMMLNLAVALYQNGQKAEAITRLKKIIALAPSFKPARLLLNRWGGNREENPGVQNHR
ncbi:MAG: tetratricopeptide repeat protein [Victivallaceae bacterium]|nr:tetratricopeptide repeat protein [Victivallaceae bacterium]